MKYISMIGLMLITLSTIAQVSPYRAPLNPDFVNQEIKQGYVQPPHKVKHQMVKLRSSEVIPASYDLRNVDGENFVSPVRNQNPYGTCWSFAAIASIESNWKISGDASFTDLSEANMAKCHGYVFGIDEGGNEYLSTAYLSRLAGPLYESADPYDSVSLEYCPSFNPESDIPAYINDVLWLGNDPELIKSMMMKYGVVSTSMKADFSSHYYNSDDYTFYYNGNEGVDHGVAIVGWDDNKVVTGGTDATPSQKGAWIIRNSWGESANNKGYFYASYEDVYIGKASELYYGKTPVSDIDTIFDYAKMGAITSYSAGNSASETGYAATKYSTDKDIFVTHIGSAILTEGTSIDLMICAQFDGQHFSDTIAYVNDVFSTYAGYQKIEFPALVPAGDFYLIMRYHTPNDTYPIPAETVVDEYVYPAIEEGLMWVSPDGENWTAGGANTDYDFDLAAKVIAKNIDGTQPYFTSDYNTACLAQNVTFENKTIGQADSFLWIFPDTSILSSTKDKSITRHFDKKGPIEVSLIAYHNDASKILTKTQAVNIVDQIYPQISIINSAERYAKGKPITLIGGGGENYRWYADGYLDGEAGKMITFAPDRDSIWVRMETTLGNCSASDSVLIKMVEVPYDDISEALQLSVGTISDAVSNAFASVQTNEPTPDIGACDTQNSWCEEGGLQNSLWFKFIAPPSGSVEIDSHGFDNQIALYDAINTGGWEDIMGGDPSQYAIIAANDDYHTDDYSAKIEQVSGLTAGKTYWIQMDGSAGGNTGSATIYVYDPDATTIKEVNTNIDVVNTPKMLHITVPDQEIKSLIICTISGQKLIQKSFTNSLYLKGSELVPGIYFATLQLSQDRLTYKIVIAQDWQLIISER